MAISVLSPACLNRGALYREHSPEEFYNRAASCQAGFTLIELLVVISIIALLISILMPALGNARSAARSIACLSGQRQFGISILAYAEDSSGLFPPHRDNVESGLADPMYWYQLLTIGDYISGKTSGDGYSDAFFCTEHEVLNRPHAFNNGLVSYGISLGLIYDYSNGPIEYALARVSDIRQPSRTIAVVDSSRGIDQPGTGSYGVYPYWTSGSSARTAWIRHRDVCNTLWVDGHASPVKATRETDPSTIHDPDALTSRGEDPNFWDRD